MHPNSNENHPNMYSMKSKTFSYQDHHHRVYRDKVIALTIHLNGVNMQQFSAVNNNMHFCNRD